MLKHLSFYQLGGHRINAPERKSSEFPVLNFNPSDIKINDSFKLSLVRRKHILNIMDIVLIKHLSTELLECIFDKLELNIASNLFLIVQEMLDLSLCRWSSCLLLFLFLCS